MGRRKNPRPSCPHTQTTPYEPPTPIRPRLQKRLQNQHRRHLVDDLLPLAPPRMPRLVQMPVRLRRRQPFIPQMHRNPELRPQLLRKRLRLRRLRTLIPRHIQRIPHHRLLHPMLPQHPRQPTSGPPLAPSRCSVNSGCAVYPSGSEIASPIRRSPTSNPKNPRRTSAPSCCYGSSPQAGLSRIGRILTHGLECNGRTVE